MQNDQSWKRHVKLFIPGPVEVCPEILKEMGRPMIGHRSREFQDLYSDTVPKLKKVLYTKNDVHLSTSSATGVFEACARNCVKGKALVCVCGAFSGKWHDVVLQNGKAAGKLEVEWGKAIKPEMVDERLSTGEYDSLFLVNNETSTGVANPLKGIADVVKKYPDVIFMVDAVSSMTGMKIEVDRLGIDVCLAGVQKAFALPPGLAVFTCSQKAYERAENVDSRGHYFDFLSFRKYAKKNQTPSTPAISQIYALNLQLDRMLGEGMEKRFLRHRRMAEYTREWVIDHGFGLFPEKGYESDTLTAVLNTRNVDVPAMISQLVERSGMTIGNGYGDIKNKTFRISHMGDVTLEEMKEMLEHLSGVLEGMK